jgi:hypothetical protein
MPLDFGTDVGADWQDLLAGRSEFGPYDPLRWRAFRYDPAAAAYVEYGAEGSGELFRLEPGRACWLICRQPSRLTNGPVDGRSTPTEGPFGITLQPGWNQVGHPYCFPVARDSLRIGGAPWAQADTLVDGPLAWRPDTGYDPDVTVLEPFAGYWFRNQDAIPLLLEVPAVEAAAAAPTVASGTDPRDWTVRIEAGTALAVDRRNLAGVRGDAADRWDRHDVAEPPPCPGPSLSLYFPHADWRHRPGPYTADYRPRSDAAGPARGDGTWGWAFPFDLAKSYSREDGDEVTLRFADLDRAPADAALRLVDRTLNRTADLRDVDVYGFHLGRRERVATASDARFLLLVGGEDFVEAATPGPPRATALRSAFPNPFNPSTLIRFEIARPCRAELRIYDLRGALVRTLFAGRAEPGGHERVWRGDDDRGRRRASGIYLCRLTTGDGYRRTIKLTLVQ